MNRGVKVSIVATFLAFFTAEALANNSLAVGDTLATNQTRESANGKYQLIMQEDGDLCIYNQEISGKKTSIWCSKTSNSSIFGLQADGKLQLFDQCKNGKIIEASTASYPNSDHLELTDDGRLVLYDNKLKHEIWSNAQDLVKVLTAAPCEHFSPISSPDPNQQSAILPPPAYLGTYYKKYLTTNGVHILGTASVSDKSMRLVYKQIDWMIRSFKNPSNRRKFLGEKIIVMSEYDKPTQMLFLYKKNNPKNDAWLKQVEDNLRGFSGNVTLVSEEMICRTGVAARITNNDVDYRGLDQVTHEFAHTIDRVLNLTPVYERVILEHKLNDPKRFKNQEYFAYQVQDWYDQEYTAYPANQKRTKTREDLKRTNPYFFEYLSTIFTDTSERVECE